MSARRKLETTVRALVFALTVVLPAGVILLVAAGAIVGEGGDYGDSLSALGAGLVRDVRSLGVFAVPAFGLYVVAIGFAVFDLRRGRRTRASRAAGRAVVLGLLGCVVVAPWSLGTTVLRPAFFLAALGLALVLGVRGWAAWRARREGWR